MLALVPVLVDLAGLHEPGDVGLDGEVDDVRRQAGLDLARLVAGGAVGLAERDALAFGRLVEGRDDEVEADLRHGVRDERELDRRDVAAGRRVVVSEPPPTSSLAPPQPTATVARRVADKARNLSEWDLT